MENGNDLEQTHNEQPSLPKDDFSFSKSLESVYTSKASAVIEGRAAKKTAMDFFKELGWKVAPRQSVKDPHDMIIASADGKMTFAVFVRYGESIGMSFNEILSIKKLGVPPALMFINRSGQYIFFIPIEFEAPTQK